MRKIYLVVILCLLLLNPKKILSADYYWTGADFANNTNWSNIANWSDVDGNAVFELPNTNQSDNVIFDPAYPAFFSGSENCTIDQNTNLNGNILVDFTIFSGYTGTITLNTTITLETTGNFVGPDGTFTTNGSGVVTIGGNFTWSSSNTFTAGTGGVSVGGDFALSNGTYLSGSSSTGLTITGAMNISSGATFTQNGTALNVTGAYTQSSGTYTNAPGPASTVFNSTFALSGGTFDKKNTGVLTINGDVTLSGTGTFTVSSSSGNITLSDASYNQTGGTFGLTGNSTITQQVNTAGGSISFSQSGGTFTHSSSTWLFKLGSVSTGTITINNTPSFNGVTIGTSSLTSDLNVNITSSITVAGTLTITNGISGTGVRSTWINTGTINHTGTSFTITAPSTYSVTPNGGGSATINLIGTTSISITNNSTEGITPLCNVSISGVATRTITTTAARFLTIGTSSDPRNFTIAGSGDFTLNGGTISANGDVTVTNSGTGGGGTTNLKITGSVTTQTLTGNSTAGQGRLPVVTVSKTTGTLNLANTISVAGTSWTHSAGTVSPGTSTVAFYNTTSSIISNSTTPTAFNNLTIAAGTLTAPSNTLTISGAFTNNGTFTHNSGNVVFNGTSTSMAGTSAPTFNNLSISTGTLTGYSGSTTIVGNWTNNGVYAPNGSKVIFNSASSQTIGGTGTTSFFNLEVNGNGNKTCEGNVNLINLFSVAGGTHVFDADGASNDKIFTIMSSTTRTGQIGDLTSAGTCTFSGNVTLQRYISGKTDWRMLGCPIQNNTLNHWYDDIPMSGFPGVSSSSFVSVYTYDELAAATGNDASLGYTAPTDASNPISWDDAAVDGKGFFVYTGNTAPGTDMTPITADMTGTIIQGNQQLDGTILTCSDGCDPAESDEGWHLVANPFPAAISFDDMQPNAGNTNLNDFYYVWDAANEGYAGWDISMGAGSAGPEIATGQSFFIQCSGGAGVLNINEEDKVTSSDTYFLKKEQAQTASSSSYIKLKIKGNSTYSDETFVEFVANATDNYNRSEDGAKIYPYALFAPSLATLTADGKDVLFNNYPPITQNISIPLRAKVKVTGTYTISPTFVNMPYACINLYDNLKDSTIDLRSSSYSFTISDTTTAPRFSINIGLAPTFTMNSSITAPTCNTQSDGYIVASPTNSGPWTYIWKDSLTGTVVKTSINKSTADTLYTGEGVYVVEINSTGGCDFSTQSFNVTAIPPAQVSLADSTVVPSLCNKLTDAYIIALPNGTGPWNYTWKDPTTDSIIKTSVNISTPDTLTGLGDGAYTVDITNSTGCEYTNQIFPVVSPNPTLVTLTSAVTQPTCYAQADANIIALPDGTGPWNYIWMDSLSNIIRTSPNISTPDTLSGLAEGKYLVEITNSTGCEYTNQIFTIVPPAPTQASFSTNADTTYLNQGGSINFTNSSVSASNYLWSFGDTSATSTLANPTHSYTDTGVYVVTLIANDTVCSVADTVTRMIYVLSSGTGIETSDLSNNVFIGQDGNGTFVKFSFSRTTNALISITNVLGQKVKEDVNVQAKDQIIYLDLKKVADGILFITVNTGDYRSSKKVFNTLR